MVREAIKQAMCTNCGQEESNYTTEESDVRIKEDRVSYDVRCSCGEKGTISVGISGVSSSGNISHENASWNEGEDEE